MPPGSDGGEPFGRLTSAEGRPEGWEAGRVAASVASSTGRIRRMSTTAVSSKRRDGGRAESPEFRDTGRGARYGPVAAASARRVESSTGPEVSTVTASGQGS